MKQVIDGKTYNTETAIEIGFFRTGLGRGDFRNRSEALYKTKKGRFFLAGRGGPMTRWATRSADGGYCGDSGIQAMITRGSLDWCEVHNIGADVITENFEIEEA